MTKNSVSDTPPVEVENNDSPVNKRFHNCWKVYDPTSCLNMNYPHAKQTPFVDTSLCVMADKVCDNISNAMMPPVKIQR